MLLSSIEIMSINVILWVFITVKVRMEEGSSNYRSSLDEDELKESKKKLLTSSGSSAEALQTSQPEILLVVDEEDEGEQIPYEVFTRKSTAVYLSKV
jgi:hypothetical protein